MSEELQEAVNASILSPGDIVTGKVTALDDKKVTVDIGYKFEGIIPIRELSALRIQHPSEVLAVGDEVHTSVLKIDEEDQVVVLSRREASAKEAWVSLQLKFEQNETLEVTVQDVVKGGLVTDVGVRGFIPASLVDRKFVEDLSEFKGKLIRVKVVEIESENNKLILSRKAVMDEEHDVAVQSSLSTLQEGDTIEGTVQRLTNFGVFVDVGGVDGLVHISEMAWHHVDHPSDLVKIGDHVRVRVLRMDPAAGRISLSMKEAANNPWDDVMEFQSGSIVNGTVRRVVDFGAFIELKPGVEGLVHISQLSQEHVNQVSDVLQEGQQVRVKILSVDPIRKRISLSLKDAQEKTRNAENKRPAAPQMQEESGTGATLGDLFRDLFKS
ncbi:30S ribosomal protein S1 [Alicyclobacillaceae bacterium I2511]|nr:30S ribosomal protein S1 [Alicyclobacillaceae bacterium I2511]